MINPLLAQVQARLEKLYADVESKAVAPDIAEALCRVADRQISLVYALQENEASKKEQA